jgi:hypothetical protein
MAVAGATAGATAASAHTSSYRVKFKRDEFIELVGIAKPRIIYQRGRMHFFAYDGFVMYTFQCRDEDFSQKILHAIEFSNYRWSE